MPSGGEEVVKDVAVAVVFAAEVADAEYKAGL